MLKTATKLKKIHQDQSETLKDMAELLRQGWTGLSSLKNVDKRKLLGEVRTVTKLFK